MSSELLDRLLADIKDAMKARNTEALTALRSLHAQVKDATVNAGKDITDEAVVAVVARAIKQRKDSVEQYRTGRRDDLADKEQQEIELLCGYQPEQLDEAAVESLVAAAIAETGASGKHDMGKVMKALMPKVKDRADGKLVSQTVQRLLG